MIAVTFASTKRVLALSASAKIVLLFAHTKWRPGQPILLPVRPTAKALAREPRMITAAICELVSVGLLERTRQHVRPGGPAAPRGRCAEYRLPHRPHVQFRAGEQLPKSGCFATLDYGDQRRPGYIKVRDAPLFALLRELDGAEPHLLWCTALRHHARDYNGAIQNIEQTAISLTEAAKFIPGCSVGDLRPLHHAARSLIAQGLLREVAPAAGRRAATVAPAGFIAAGLPTTKTKAGGTRQEATDMVNTRVLPNGGQTGKKGAKSGDRSGSNEFARPLAPLSKLQNERCSPFGGTVNNSRSRNDCICRHLPALLPFDAPARVIPLRVPQMTGTAT